MIRVVLPSHLRALARVADELRLARDGIVSQADLLSALEAMHPALRGAIRDHATGRRRPMIRFFGCGADLSHLGLGAALPEAILEGREAFLIVGAIAGG